MYAAQHLLRTCNNYLISGGRRYKFSYLINENNILRGWRRSESIAHGGRKLGRRQRVLEGEAELSGFLDQIKKA